MEPGPEIFKRLWALPRIRVDLSILETSLAKFG